MRDVSSLSVIGFLSGLWCLVAVACSVPDAARTGPYACLDDRQCAVGWRCDPAAGTCSATRWPEAGVRDTAAGADAATDTGARRDVRSPPDSVVPDSAVPDSAVLDTAVIDTMVTDTTVTDTMVADTVVTDAATPDIAAPDAAMVDRDAELRDAELRDAELSDAGRSDGTVDAAIGSLPITIEPPRLDFETQRADCEPKEIRALITAGESACLRRPRLKGDGCNAYQLFHEWPEDGQLGEVRCTSIEPGAPLEVLVELSTDVLGAYECELLIEGAAQIRAPIVATLSGVVGDGRRRVSFESTRPARVDVLFVVDNSASMEAHQTQLSERAAEFLEAALADGVDFNIGVTTTDVEGMAPGALVGEPAWVTAQTPDVAAALAANLRVGVDGSVTERGLEAARSAMMTNAGWPRADATIELVFVSDADDASVEDIEVYLRAFIDANSNRSESVAAHAIAFPTGPDRAGCDADARGGAATRYAALVERLVGRFEAICLPEFGGGVGRIGALTFGPRWRYRLEPRIDAAALGVWIDGDVVAPERFAWVPEAEALVFRPAAGAPPSLGQTIEVEYAVGCE